MRRHVSRSRARLPGGQRGATHARIGGAMATAAQAPTANRHVVKRVGWGVMLALALVLVLFAARYFSLNPAVYFPQQRAVYVANTPILLLHISGPILAAIIGPFQFLPVMRSRYIRQHRWLGRAYLLG